jgi:rhodanese-related sulfurtransferase
MVKEAQLTELEQAQAQGRRVVDVRGPEEYAEGHVPGAELLPLDQLPARLAQLPQGEPVYVLCRSGNRSAQAADYLGGNGIDARSVAGGTDAWQRSGRPLESGPAHS